MLLKHKSLTLRRLLAMVARISGVAFAGFRQGF
jgi:hypothetical protein